MCGKNKEKIVFYFKAFFPLPIKLWKKSNVKICFLKTDTKAINLSWSLLAEITAQVIGKDITNAI